MEVQRAITGDLLQPKTEVEPRAIPTPVDASQLRERTGSDKETKTIRPVREIAPEASNHPAEKTSKRPQLTTGSPIVDAPAIGPKTAVRLEAIGLDTIQDLLSHDAERIAGELNTKWITARLVSQWQDQARLACQIDRLSAAGAGLLVLAGIRTAEDLATRRPSEAFSLIQAAARTPEGQRLLRDQEPPPLKTVQRWMDAACECPRV
jgi:hypothetical protein